MRARLIIAAGVVVAIGLAAGWFVFRKHRTPPAKTAAPAVFNEPELTLFGRIEAQDVEPVEAPIDGTLEAWFVNEGAEVFEDQLVGRIYNADLDDALQKAQARLDKAQLRVTQIEAAETASKLDVSRATADQTRAHNELDRIEKLYQRYKRLMEADALARLTWEKTEADYKSAKDEAAKDDAAADDAQKKAADLDRDSEDAKHALDDATAEVAKAKDAIAVCDLHSPADGVVDARNAHQGEHVEKGKPLMTVAADLTKLTVTVAPGPQALARIKAGAHAFVRIGDQEIAGEVKEIRGTDVVVNFTTAEAATKPGAAAQVRIIF